MAPINWYSKKQTSIECSTFGAELVVLGVAIDKVEAFIYTISGPARIFCNNDVVVTTCKFPESTLKKKNCSITCHRIREAVASKMWHLF